MENKAGFPHCTVKHSLFVLLLPFLPSLQFLLSAVYLVLTLGLGVIVSVCGYSQHGNKTWLELELCEVLLGIIYIT